MRASAAGEVATEAENIQGQVGQVEVSGTCDALSHRMVATVGEEEQALFGAQDPRLLTIEGWDRRSGPNRMVSPGEIVREHCGHTSAGCSIRHASTRGTIACRIRGKDRLFPRKSPENALVSVSFGSKSDAQGPDRVNLPLLLRFSSERHGQRPKRQPQRNVRRFISG